MTRIKEFIALIKPHGYVHQAVQVTATEWQLIARNDLDPPFKCGATSESDLYELAIASFEDHIKNLGQ